MTRRTGSRAAAFLLALCFILGLAATAPPGAQAGESYDGKEDNPVPTGGGSVTFMGMGFSAGPVVITSGSNFIIWPSVAVDTDGSLSLTVEVPENTGDYREIAVTLEDSGGKTGIGTRYQKGAPRLSCSTGSAINMTYAGGEISLTLLGGNLYLGANPDVITSADVSLLSAVTGAGLAARPVQGVTLSDSAVAITYPVPGHPYNGAIDGSADGDITAVIPYNPGAGRVIDLKFGLGGAETTISVAQSANPALSAAVAGDTGAVPKAGGRKTVKLSSAGSFIDDLLPGEAGKPYQRDVQFTSVTVDGAALNAETQDVLSFNAQPGDGSAPGKNQVTLGAFDSDPRVAILSPARHGNYPFEADERGRAPDEIEFLIAPNPGSAPRVIEVEFGLLGAVSNKITINQAGAPSSPTIVSAPITPAAPAAAPVAPTSPLARNLTVASLDALFGDSVSAALTYPASDLASVTLPVGWFAKNADKTLTVNVDGLGSFTVSGRTLLELAMAATDRTSPDLTSVTVGGETFTFSPDTDITFRLERGSVKLDVISDGKPVNWLLYTAPVTLTVPFAPADIEDPDCLVVYEKLESGEPKLVALSTYDGGVATAFVNHGGHYDVIYNKVEFDDVTGGWMEDAAGYVGARGIMNGVGGNRFDPQSPVTRAQFVTMLMRAFDVSVKGQWMPEPAADQADIPVWAETAVNKARAMGIVAGGDGESFLPNAPITREDMFTVTYNLMKSYYLIETPEGGMALSEFNDAADISEYAAEAMLALVGRGLVQGSGGSLNPAGASTRAEAAQFITNVIKDTVKAPDIKAAVKMT